jgi:hypothetical protein
MCLRVRIDRSLVVLVLLVAGALPASLPAQICEGSPSFSVGPVQLGVGANFGHASKSIGLTAGVGARQGGFIETGLAMDSYDGVDGTGVTSNLGIGYDIAVTPATTSTAISLCPLASVSYSTSPSLSDGIDTYREHEIDAGVGIALGVSVPVSPNVALIPFGGFWYVRAHETLNVTGFQNGSQSASDSFGSANLGVGILLNRRISLEPGVSIPVGLSGAKPGFDFSVNFQVGSRQ